jgi:hypothetical protein
MSAAPNVTRLVLFKHGIAYVERHGAVEGAFELSFAQNEMADILKSFTAWVQKGSATVGWVGFDKPEDPSEALSRKNLLLDGQSILSGFLTTTTGRKVRLTTAAGSVEGEYVGLETEQPGNHAVIRRAVLRTGNSATLVSLSEVTAFELLDKNSQDNLDYFLDRRRAAQAGENKTILVDVKGSAEDLGVSYIVPAPTWRVSYRVVLEGEHATFMGWGIVHNPLASDIEDVELILTTGQPNSFMIDLYNPRDIQRTVVEESARVASMESPMMLRARGSVLPSTMMQRPASYDDDVVQTLVPSNLGDSRMESTAMEARGDFFEYRVKTPVSMRNGGSSMVPLFSTRVPAKKERLWTPSTSSEHPDIVLRMKNETGAVLEEGPAVLYDEALYAGEAMVPFKPKGAEVVLAFAKDLGAHCQISRSQKEVFTRVYLARGGFLQELRIEETQTLLLKNENEHEVTVRFDLPIRASNREFTPESTKPFHSSPSVHSFWVTAAADGTQTVTVTERWLESRSFSWAGVTLRHLTNWLSNKFLDEATIGELEAVLVLEAKALSLKEESEALRHQVRIEGDRQARLKAQLEVLRDGGPEGEMRLRVVRKRSAEGSSVSMSNV